MHGVLKAPLFAFTLACVAGLSFDAFFIKENRWGKLWGFVFSIHVARFLVCPRLRVSRTHTGQKNNQKTASYPGYLYTNGGTSPHSHLVPIRLLWLVPAKKAVLFVMRKPYSITLQPHCSDQPAYFLAISPSLKTTTQTNWGGTVRETKNVCQMSCLSLLKWPQVVSKYCHGVTWRYRPSNLTLTC